ncbi:MAG TPA: DNA replication and repair protein RecF [Ferruginibacter sp.]|nr:DNA replication and repair protein RecF [Ferruginibacter sp.]HMP21952.1 DNA replication and repair protein RecF [Ferruginibacter sp.]
MPLFSALTITQFKNYDYARYAFTEKVVGICGLNGQGKTNMLDALYYLCFTKSYFTATDSLNIRFGLDGFRLEAQTTDNQKIVCIHRGSAGKKELFLNDIPYNKFSEHIGKFPAVMVAPDDAELISSGSEIRRRFLDTLICQVNNNYLQQLVNYNKTLQQRNSLLKRFTEQGHSDYTLLEVLDNQLIQPAEYIYQQRFEYTRQLISLAQKEYAQITAGSEAVTIQYSSQLHNTPLHQLLLQNRNKDQVLQRTTAGIHRDDLELLLHQQPFKNTASQGQRKSLLFALKLAEFEILKNEKGQAPLLLLDDVFEKLDDNRITQLLQRVCRENNGQVLITDTHCQRLEDAFKAMQIAYQIISL